MPTWSQAVLLVAAAGLSAAITAWLLLRVWVPRIEAHLIFRPTRHVLRHPAQSGVPCEDHWIDTPDGCRLAAWHLSPPRPRAAVVYFHGNGGNLGLLTELFAVHYRWGLQVLAVDYRGYGRSSGKPTEDGVYTDALATVAYFRQRLRVHDAPLAYWGRSLGTVIAARAAAALPPDALVLESGFPGKDQLVGGTPRMRLYRHFSRTRLDTLANLEGLQVPALVVHGDRDRTVPLEQGKALFEGLRGPRELYVVEGADHITTHLVDTPAYMRRVVGFLEGCRRAPGGRPQCST